jgi:hypothetical protein
VIGVIVKHEKRAVIGVIVKQTNKQTNKHEKRAVIGVIVKRV